MHPKLWPFFLPLISPKVYNGTLKPAAPFVSKDCSIKTADKKLTVNRDGKVNQRKREKITEEMEGFKRSQVLAIRIKYQKGEKKKKQLRSGQH